MPAAPFQRAGQLPQRAGRLPQRVAPNLLRVLQAAAEPGHIRFVRICFVVDVTQTIRVGSCEIVKKTDTKVSCQIDKHKNEKSRQDFF